MVHVGAGNYVRAEQVRGVLPYDARKDSAVYRLIKREAKTHRVWDLSGKHRARSVIVADTDLFVTFLSPEAVTRRLAEALKSR